MQRKLACGRVFKPSSAVARLLTITLLLAFMGGYADAVSFLLNKAFSGHVTGNTVLFGVHLVQGAWQAALLNVCAVLAFLAGTAGAELVQLEANTPDPTQKLRGPLLLEGALLGLALLGRFYHGWLGDAPCLLCLCLALGWQNGTLTKCGAASVHTTFLTGMGTSLLSSLLKRRLGKAPADEPSTNALKVLGSVLVLFAVGAVLGGWVSTCKPDWSLGGLLVPWLAALGVCLSRQTSAPA